MKQNLYTYRAELIRIVDGDTIEAMVDLGFDTWTKRFIDLSDIDAPEIRTKDLQEKKLGLEAKKELEKMITDEFYLKSEDYNAFGRSSAVIYNKFGLNIGEELFSQGLIEKSKFTIKGHNVTLGSEK